MIELSRDEARWAALAAQGFDRPRPRRVDLRHVRRVLRELGLVQIDYVNVLVPAHYLTIFSRLGPYDRRRLDDLLFRRREFLEQWAHEASIVPMQAWPLMQARARADRRAPHFASFLAKHGEYAAKVLAHVECAGPVTPQELPQLPRPPGPRSAWGWSPAKTAIEAHFYEGRVAIANRLSNFTRVYDLAERLVPADIHAQRIEIDDARRALVYGAARCLGVGTLGDLADVYRLPIRDTKPALEALVDAGHLREIHVEDWKDVAYATTPRPRPRPVAATCLLAPFDSLVWSRPRMLRLFDFDHRIEIFVPKEKRRWGWYVLPFLQGDRLVARVDLKADRPARTLRVLAAHREDHAEAGVVAPALRDELKTLASWLGLRHVLVGRRGNLARVLASALD